MTNENRRGPLDLNKLIEIENSIGYKLPKSYLNLMEHQNGGKLKKGTIQITKRTGIKHIDTGRFYPLEDLIKNYREHVSIIEEQLAFSDHNKEVYQAYKHIVPISVENHGYVCLDYRNQVANPAVVYFYDEDLVDYFIAASFDSFIEKLE
ncbi:SMI1/KNR4 family protein [Paenibacillus koleovorans]|uniref:SMI1/KNR4 family protein n=1 Tax=Paenibacillus koleovorans TaxID=121608 RepID=UPI001FE9A48C|nr:SMI1/KNR4 family protein [Paenibacillus koleovorans]